MRLNVVQEKCLTSAEPNVPGQAFQSHTLSAAAGLLSADPAPSKAGELCREAMSAMHRPVGVAGREQHLAFNPHVSCASEELCSLHCSGLQRCPQQLSGGVEPSTAELG